MTKTIQENSAYFLLSGIFVLLGGLYLLSSDKADAIVFFSENRTPFLNAFFKIITKLGEEPVYLLLGLGALVVRPRYSALIATIGILVMGLSYILKQYFAIDRPKAFFLRQGTLDQLNLINGVELHAGATSFPSGHSMSGFALFTLLALLAPNKKAAYPLFTIAVLIGLSRIYLVQHFWPDVYAGGLIGICLALLLYQIQRKYWPEGERAA